MVRRTAALKLLSISYVYGTVYGTAGYRTVLYFDYRCKEVEML